MTYKSFISLLLTLTLLLGFMVLPGLSNLKHNTEIDYLNVHPDETFEIFSQCKIKVSDVNRCYNAYSAAVNLADSTDCSSEGIREQFKFKMLVESNSGRTVNDEIKKVCPHARFKIPET